MIKLAATVGILAWAVPLLVARALAPYRYAGRHRAVRGPSTSVAARRSASYRASLEAYEHLASLVVPVTEVPVAELPAVAPKLGVGRYAHLRPDELDTTAERLLLLGELGIAPPRSAWLDEWATDDLAAVTT